MFSALHWDYLHRVGLVAPYPAALGVAAGIGGHDDQLRSELLSAGVMVETADGLVLEESKRPVLEAFTAPTVKLFGTTLLYRDSVPRPGVGDDVPEGLRALAEATAVVVPQSKFLVAVSDVVVAAAVQYCGLVSLTGVDCGHADPVVQAARLLWEALAPGDAHTELEEVTVPMPALAAVAPIRVDTTDDECAQPGLERASAVLAEAGVGKERASELVALLREPPLAAAQVCVSVWANHHEERSTDAALALMQFKQGSVLSVPSWRLDGSCHVTYMPATAGRWEKEVAEFIARYEHRARIA